MSRLVQILKMLERKPDDAFLLYGAGIEYRKQSDPTTAVAYFDKTLAVDPAFCYAYYQKGQTLEEAGDLDGAVSAYRAGIDAARRVGDAKALGELQAALDMLV